ncbi:MAG TPA: type 1 glutamine amidotransferase [archaeon]|nr:type 1 glutamine amidotransferase [archaeon]
MALRKKIKSQSKNRVLIVQNSESEGPGLLELVLKKNRITYKTVDLGRDAEIPNFSDYSAVIVLGGPDSANDRAEKILGELKKTKEAIDAGIPFLGICLGMQVLVKAAGGEVLKNSVKEIGWKDFEGKYFNISLTEQGKKDALFSNLGAELKIFQLHGETVKLPEDAVLLASGKHCKNQAVRVGKNAYGIQGHFELTREMLVEWIASDPDLRALNQDSLMESYLKIAAEYNNTGKKLFENFLRIAKLRAD